VVGADIAEREEDAKDAQCVGLVEQLIERRLPEEVPVGASTSKGGRTTAKRAFRFSLFAFRFTIGWGEEQKNERRPSRRRRAGWPAATPLIR
jgi:hypothetical protein